MSNDEDVIDTSGEGVSSGVLNVNDIDGSWVLFLLGDDSDTSQVVSSGDHDQVSDFELDVSDDLVGFEVEFDRVVSLDVWVWVTDGTSVVCVDVWNSLCSNPLSLNAQQFELGFLGGDWENGETSTGIVQNAEVFVGLSNCDDI